MKKKISYKTPELRIWEAGEDIMELNLPVSTAEVDDEAAKERYDDVEGDNKDWGEINNSLW